MPTPDPIALPELPVAVARIHSDGYWTTDDRRPDWKWPARTDVFSSDQMRAYGQACVEALTPAPQVPEGMVLVPRVALDWLNGEGEEGFECPPDRYFRGEPPRYWWRSVFREKAGLSAVPSTKDAEER